MTPQEELAALRRMAELEDKAARKPAWQPRKRSPQDLRDSAEAYRLQNPVTADMNAGQKFVAGFGKSFVDTGRGLGQLVGLADTADVDRASQTDEALMGDGWGIGGNLAGTVTQIVSPGVVLKAASKAPAAIAYAPKLANASRAFLPNTLRGNAAQGGVIGLMQQTGEGDSRLQNGLTGLAAGYVGAALPRGLGALKRATGSYSGNVLPSAVERRAAEIIRSEADNPVTLAAVNPSRIPGAVRSLAEETLDPGIARLERNARSTGKGWDSLDRTNNAARVAAIERFAGNEQTMAQAVKAREVASNGLRKEAMKYEGVDTSRLLSQIKRMERAYEGRPSVQTGLSQLRGLLTREVPYTERSKAAIGPLEAFIAADRTSATNREAAKAAINQIKAGERPMAQFVGTQAGTRGLSSSHEAARAALLDARKAWDQTHVGHDKVAVLDNVRKTMGEMLSGKYGGDSAQALAGSREIMAVKGQLDRVLAKQAPEYAQYLDAYRGGSVPINRMELGQSLMSSRSGSAILDPVTGKQVLTPAAFSGRARNLDKVAADATGFRKAKAENMLKPEDFSAIRNVQDDLERRSFAATAGSGGNSQTFERMALNDRVAGGLMGRIPIVGRAFEYLGEIGETRLQAKLSQILQNPAEARAILARLPANDRRALENALSRAGGVGGAALPAVIE